MTPLHALGVLKSKTPPEPRIGPRKKAASTKIAMRTFRVFLDLRIYSTKKKLYLRTTGENRPIAQNGKNYSSFQE
jgi:hypothetical protein